MNKLKKVNLGLIGCGYWGPNLVRNFSSIPECNLKYVCDIDTTRTDLIKKDYPFINLTSDYTDVLNDPEVDAVAIATHVSTHRKIAEDSFRAGKHVFVEKPMASTTEDAAAMVKLSKKFNKKLAVGHVFQYAPAVRKIKQLLDKDTIGDILHISSTRINLGPPDTEVDVIWDLAPHDFSIILYLLNDYPRKIECEKNYFPFSFLEKRNKTRKPLTNNAHIDLEFKNKTTAHIHLSWLSANKIRFMQIFGTKGTLVYDEMLALDGKLKLYGKGIDNRLKRSKNKAGKLAYNPGEIKILELEQHEPLRLECETFINSIIKDKDLVNDGRIGLDVVRLIETSMHCKNGR